PLRPCAARTDARRADFRSFPPRAVQPRNRRSTFAVTFDTPSSTSTELGQVIDPTERTAPPDGGSHATICAPPSSTFNPFASSRTFCGDDGEIVSVSCPEAPPGQRRCRL